MSYDQAVFIEPLACVYRGQHNAGWKPGRRVLVVGSGIAGLMHIALARVAGASRVIAVDVNQSRLDAALKLGADQALLAGGDLPDRLKEINDGLPADLVIVATGAEPALNQAFQLVDRGGTILFFAPADPNTRVEMPFNDWWWQEVNICSTYAGSPRDIRAAIELVSTGRIQVEDMITHRLPLEKTSEGFQMVAKAADSIKVIIQPQK